MARAAASGEFEPHHPSILLIVRPLASHPLPPVLGPRSAVDCQRAKAANLTSAACLCEPSQPFLHCHALAAKEAAARVQTTLSDADALLDPLTTTANITVTCFNTSDGSSLPPVDATSAKGELLRAA